MVGFLYLLTEFIKHYTMKHFVFGSIFILLMYSCNKQETQISEVHTSTKTNTFVIDSVRVKDSMVITKNLTSLFNKQVLVFPDIKNKALLDSIYANANLQLSTFDKADVQRVLKDSMQAQFSSTQRGMKDYSPDFPQTWEDDAEMKVISHRKNVLALQYTGYSFTGGAHGMSYELYKNVDLKAEKILNQNNVLINPKDPAWNDILMKNFKEPDQKEMLLEDKIRPNNNFYFDDKQITFVYNQYEITAYAAGIVRISVSFSEIKDKLKPEFIKDYNIQ